MLDVTFWGVRGSIAVSGEGFRRYGGNTTCLEVRCGQQRIIVDAGTGLQALGGKLMAESQAQGAPVKATMLFTHLHWDHIQGFPFFAPAFLPSTELDLYGPCSEGQTLRGALEAQMRPPQFPVPLDAMASAKRFHTLDDGDAVQVGEITVRTRRLDHPQGVLGYRFEAGGRAICFATDTEHPADGSVHEGLLELARGADLLIYDAQYTPDEYAGRRGPCRRGWGHSTYEAAAEIARAAEVSRLVLFHHDPTHEDDVVDAIAAEARGLFPWTQAAREGLTLEAA